MNFTTKAVALNHGLQVGNLFRILVNLTLFIPIFFTFGLFSYQNHIMHYAHFYCSFTFLYVKLPISNIPEFLFT